MRLSDNHVVRVKPKPETWQSFEEEVRRIGGEWACDDREIFVTNQPGMSPATIGKTFEQFGSASVEKLTQQHLDDYKAFELEERLAAKGWL